MSRKTRRERGRANAAERQRVLREQRAHAGEAETMPGAQPREPEPKHGLMRLLDPDRKHLLLDTSCVAALGLALALLLKNPHGFLARSAATEAMLIALLGAWLALAVVSFLMTMYYRGMGQPEKRPFSKPAERHALLMWSLVVVVATVIIAADRLLGL